MKAFVAFSVAGLLTAGVSGAFAQSNQPRESRPDRSLFGSGNTTGMDQALTVGGQAGVGYDDNTLPGQRDTPLQNVSAPYSQLAGSLQYMLKKGHANAHASAGASVAHYASLDGANAATYYGDFGGAFQLSRRTTLNATQRFTYQPLYSLVRTPAVSPDTALDPLAPDLGATVVEQPAGSTQPAFSWSESSVTLSQSVSRHVSLYGGVTHSQTAGEVTTPGYRSSMLVGGVSWQAAKELSVHFNYGYGNINYRGRQGVEDTTYRRQNFDAGVNYNHALSISRRTKVGFWTGSTAITDSVTGTGKTHFYVLGGVNLSREVGRTWGAVVAYNHNVEFIDTFIAPVQYDSLVLSYGGLISRRVRVDTFVGASLGSVGFTGTDNGYYTYYAGANVQYALTRRYGLQGSYSYYQYHYENGVVLPEGYPSAFDRNSVRAQFVVQVPIFQRRGKQNATR